MRASEAEEHLLAAGLVRRGSTSSDDTSDDEPPFQSKAPLGARCCDEALFGPSRLIEPPDRHWKRQESHPGARWAARAGRLLTKLLLVVCWAVSVLCVVGPDAETHRLRRFLLPQWAGGGPAAAATPPPHVLLAFWLGVGVAAPMVLLSAIGCLCEREIRASRLRTTALGDHPEEDAQSVSTLEYRELYSRQVHK